MRWPVSGGSSMSRSIIGGIVAVIIAALTATAYFVTTSSHKTRSSRTSAIALDARATS